MTGYPIYRPISTEPRNEQHRNPDQPPQEPRGCDSIQIQKRDGKRYETFTVSLLYVNQYHRELYPLASCRKTTYFTGRGEPPTVSTLRQYYHGTTTTILITVQLQSHREHSNSLPTRYRSTILSFFTGSFLRAPLTNCTFYLGLWPSSLSIPTFLVRCLFSTDCTYRLKLERPSYQSNIYFIRSSLSYLVCFDCCPFPIPRDAMFSIGTSRWLKLYRISKYWRILKSASSVSYCFPSTFNL